MLLDALSVPLFRTLARLRGARVFHPRGAAYGAVWAPATDGPLHGDGPWGTGMSRAVVRVSRGAGLPPPLPDVLGVAIKVLDAHGPGQDQDLLLASVASGGAGRRLMLPRRTFAGATFSSLLPYDVQGRRTPVVATLTGEPSTTPPALDASEGLDEVREVRVDVWLGGSDEPLGSVTLTRPLPGEIGEDLRFDPWHTGGSMQPVGRLNRLRRPVYVASQRGRSAPQDGARDGRLERWLG